MKKLYYLIILALILGLVLTGCLLSNVGQVPTTEQSGITYLTKGKLDPVDLVGLWHFDEGSGVTTVADSSGNGNDGNVYEATTGVSGEFGNALSFDGLDEYVSVPDSTSLDLLGEITVEAWIKVAVHKNYNAIVIKGEDGAENYELLLTSSGLLYSTIKFTDGTRYYPSVPNAITDTEWHHVAMTYKPGEWRIYVDGVKEAERMDISKTPLINDVPLFIGAEQYNGSLMSGRFFNGTIDEVRIWDGALTAEQIEDSFNHGIVIQKGMSQDDANLGDHVTVILEVVTAPETVFITDTLPDELRYMPGSFMVDGVSDAPTVVGQTISYTLTPPCAHTITFDAQVTSAEAELKTVINNATTADGASASAELTIHPYEGFEKVVDIIYEDTDDDIVEVGELVQWDMTITVPNNFGWPISLATLSDRLGGELGMAGDDVDNDLDGVIDNGPSGDLSTLYNNIPCGTLDIVVRGKANKVQFEITGIDISSNGSEVFTLGIFTDKNPAGKQSYSTDGTYELNSGAVLKFIDPGTGFQLSAHTPPLTVDVTEPE